MSEFVHDSATVLRSLGGAISAWGGTHFEARIRMNRFLASVSVANGLPEGVPVGQSEAVNGGLLTVERVMSRSFVNLPGWFPVNKAASVLRSLRREFVLIADPRGGVTVASLADLARAPDDKTAAWCATGAVGFVTPLDTVAQAWRKMLDLKTERLPVKVGDLIVGIVTSSTLRRVAGSSKRIEQVGGPAQAVEAAPPAILAA